MLTAEDIDSSKTRTLSSSCLESSRAHHQQCSVWGKRKVLKGHTILIIKYQFPIFSTTRSIGRTDFHSQHILWGSMTHWRKATGELPGGRVAFSHFLPSGYLFPSLKKESGKNVGRLRGKLFLIGSNCSWKYLSIAALRNSSTEPKQDCIKDVCNLASVLFLFVTETANFLQYPFPTSSINNTDFS